MIYSKRIFLGIEYIFFAFPCGMTFDKQQGVFHQEMKSNREIGIRYSDSKKAQAVIIYIFYNTRKSWISTVKKLCLNVMRYAFVKYRAEG